MSDWKDLFNTPTAPFEKKEKESQTFPKCSNPMNKRQVCMVADCPRKYFKTSSERLYISAIDEKVFAERSSLCEHRVYERSKQFSVDFVDGQIVVASPLLCPFPSRKGGMMLMVSTGEPVIVQSENVKASVFMQFGFFGRCFESQSQQLYKNFAVENSETSFLRRRTGLRTKVQVKDKNLILTIQLSKPKIAENHRSYEFLLDPGRHQTSRGMDATFAILSLNGMQLGLTYAISVEIDKRNYDSYKASHPNSDGESPQKRL